MRFSDLDRETMRRDWEFNIYRACDEEDAAAERLLDALYGGKPVLHDGERNHVEPTAADEVRGILGEPVPSFADDDPYGSCACGCGAEGTELLVCLNAPGEERLFVDLLHLHRWVVKRLEEAG